MSNICFVKLDSVQVPRGGRITAYWSKYHTIDISFKCDIPLEPCHEKFIVKADGKTVTSTNIIDIPGAPVLPQLAQCTPIDTIQIPELSPGLHTITIEVEEHPIIGSPNIIDKYTFTTNIQKVSDDQTQPTPAPIPPQPPSPLDQLSKFLSDNWWWLLPAGVLAIAVFTAPSREEKETRELEELMKLKLMKEIGE